MSNNERGWFDDDYRDDPIYEDDPSQWIYDSWDCFYEKDVG